LRHSGSCGFHWLGFRFRLHRRTGRDRFLAIAIKDDGLRHACLLALARQCHDTADDVAIA
jgi:hypothetical protein